MIKGFSKLSKSEKIAYLVQQNILDQDDIKNISDTNYPNTDFQTALEGFSENVFGNFHFPFSIAPNFLINGTEYVVPMVTEESSVVAAASAAASFWYQYGGFTCKLSGTRKEGQLFFEWNGTPDMLNNHLSEIELAVREALKSITLNMEARGGGLTSLKLHQHSGVALNCYELKAGFETADSMGANFINTCLEEMGKVLKEYASKHFSKPLNTVEIIMAILSNHTPGCVVSCSLKAPFEAFNRFDPDENGERFALRFKKAVDIAYNDTYRAVTHNKGIFNGISSVLLATGNDFRAVEAAGHAYAVKKGMYRSLSKARIEDRQLIVSLDVPLAVGTVGGLTKLHPMANTALKILGRPNAATLMQVIASVGMASHFSAIKALITSGIQKGHMKMHLNNILIQLGANTDQKERAQEYFKDRTVSVSAVREFLNNKL